jgi:hypothetical protein
VTTSDPLAGRPLLAFAIRNGAAFVLAGALLYVMLGEQRAQLREIDARSAEMLTLMQAMVGRCLDATTKPIGR